MALARADRRAHRSWPRRARDPRHTPSVHRRRERRRARSRSRRRRARRARPADRPRAAAGLARAGDLPHGRAPRARRAGRPLRQQPACDRADRRQVVGRGAPCDGRRANPAHDRVRALRRRDAGVRSAGRRRRREAAVRRDGRRDRARGGPGRRPPRIPRARARADRLLRPAHGGAGRPPEPARARCRRRGGGRNGARDRLVAGERMRVAPARSR